MPTLKDYQQEYSKYLQIWKDYPAIMPSFLAYLKSKQDTAGQKEQWDKYRFYQGLIDIELEDEYEEQPEQDQHSDADAGL